MRSRLSLLLRWFTVVACLVVISQGVAVHRAGLSTLHGSFRDALTACVP